MKRGRWVLRAAAGVVLFLALGGPAPGNVGGCGNVPVADARQFCVEQGYWECRRDYIAGRTTQQEEADCHRELETRCAGRAWPPGCLPSVDQTEVCFQLLRRMDLAQLTTEELYELYTECDICR